VRFEGRDIDALALWSNYVEFPADLHIDGKFLPLVKCPNPDHDTEKRHFQINIEDGLVHCFALCGISGTYTKAISAIEGCSEREARKIILGHKRKGSGNSDKRAKNREPRKGRDKIEIPAFDSYLPPVALDYLASREITENSVAAWELGWDSDEKRIVIPAKDNRRITRFLVKRSVFPHQHPKYLYAPEGVSKNSLLFGGCFCDPGLIRSHGLILVEGSLDAIRLYQHGHRNVVATLGTGISEIQRRIVSRLRPRRIYTFFDRDAAGVHGIEIVQRRLGRYPIFVVRYPAGRNDPAELTRREVERAITRAIPLSRFMARQVAVLNAY
jgi:DNA primase